METGNQKDYVIEKLNSYKDRDILITPHAKAQAYVRGISEQEIKENLRNPKRLAFAGKQEARKDEEKFDCYFVYSNTQCQRYVIVFGRLLIVCTAIKVNRRWQKRVERYERI